MSDEIPPPSPSGVTLPVTKSGRLSLMGNSVPPEARVWQARSDFAAHLIGAVAEVVGMVLCSFLLYHGKIGTEVWAGTMAYCMGGTVVSKVRGKIPSSTTVTLIALGAHIPWLIRHWTVIGLAVLLSACAGSPLFSDDGRLRSDPDNTCADLILRYYEGRQTLAIACTAAQEVEGVRSVCKSLEPVVAMSDFVVSSGDCGLLQEAVDTLDMDVRAISRTKRLVDRIKVKLE